MLMMIRLSRFLKALARWWKASASSNLNLIKISHFECKQKSPPRALFSSRTRRIEKRRKSVFVISFFVVIVTTTSCWREWERTNLRWAHATKNKSRENRQEKAVEWARKRKNVVEEKFCCAYKYVKLCHVNWLRLCQFIFSRCVFIFLIADLF